MNGNPKLSDLEGQWLAFYASYLLVFGFIHAQGEQKNQDISGCFRWINLAQTISQCKSAALSYCQPSPTAAESWALLPSKEDMSRVPTLLTTNFVVALTNIIRLQIESSQMSLKIYYISSLSKHTCAKFTHGDTQVHMRTCIHKHAYIALKQIWYTKQACISLIYLVLYFIICEALEIRRVLISLYYLPRDSRANCRFIYFFSHTFPEACSGNENNFRYISTALKVVIIIIQKNLVACKYLNFILSILALWVLAVSLNWCLYILRFFSNFRNKIANNNSNHKRTLLFKLSLRVWHPSRCWWVFRKEI